MPSFFDKVPAIAAKFITHKDAGLLIPDLYTVF